MLAISPLRPEEAQFVLRNSLEIISRASYYDDAEAVDNLLLILATTDSIRTPATANTAVDRSRGSAIAPERAALFLASLVIVAFFY